MLSAGKPLQWVADQLGHVGVKKIDEVYGRWKQRYKLPDKQLDLDALFRSFRTPPPFAISKAPIDLLEASHINLQLASSQRSPKTIQH